MNHLSVSCHANSHCTRAEPLTQRPHIRSQNAPNTISQSRQSLSLPIRGGSMGKHEPCKHTTYLAPFFPTAPIRPLPPTSSSQPASITPMTFPSFQLIVSLSELLTHSRRTRTSISGVCPARPFFCTRDNTAARCLTLYMCRPSTPRTLQQLRSTPVKLQISRHLPPGFTQLMHSTPCSCMLCTYMLCSGTAHPAHACMHTKSCKPCRLIASTRRITSTLAAPISRCARSQPLFLGPGSPHPDTLPQTHSNCTSSSAARLPRPPPHWLAYSPEPLPTSPLYGIDAPRSYYLLLTPY